MKLAIYLAAVPKNKNEKKIAILKNFGAGASANNESVIYVENYTVVPSDIAVMQGFVHKDFTPPHLKLRKNILESNKRTVIIDSNLFQFSNPALANYYLRYSLNGIFPNTGFYFDNRIDHTRWASISKTMGMTLKDYRKNGNHILICLQRIGGWSMGDTDVQKWLKSVVKQIRNHTDRPILVRRHPGDKKQETISLPNIKFSKSPSIIDDLRNAWATVTFNSSPCVPSLIEGIPVFVTDPIPQKSQCWPICDTDLSKIEIPTLHDREPWIHKLSQSHWNDEEVISGAAWRFLKERIDLKNI